MGLDKKTFAEEISKIKKIKASHISDERVNEILRRSMNGNGQRPSKLDIEIATNILYSQGYRINTGREKGYINPNFGYKRR